YEDLNQTYDDIPMGYYSLNSQGKLVYINQSILELLGYDKEELLGRSMADLLVNELKDCFRINYPLFKKRGEIKHQQLLMQHKNGQQVPVMMNAKVIKDEKNKFLMTRTFIMEI
ncbi:MAG: PAS domain-containing protein, partial [Microcystaceae cyanobacterium]